MAEPKEIPSYGTRDLRIHMREAIDHALRGRHVEITRHGRPEAYIVPADWYDLVSDLLAGRVDVPGGPDHR